MLVFSILMLFVPSFTAYTYVTNKNIKHSSINLVEVELNQVTFSQQLAATLSVQQAANTIDGISQSAGLLATMSEELKNKKVQAIAYGR